MSLPYYFAIHPLCYPFGVLDSRVSATGGYHHRQWMCQPFGLGIDLAVEVIWTNTDKLYDCGGMPIELGFALRNLFSSFSAPDSV